VFYTISSYLRSSEGRQAPNWPSRKACSLGPETEQIRPVTTGIIVEGILGSSDEYAVTDDIEIEKKKGGLTVKLKARKYGGFSRAKSRGGVLGKWFSSFVSYWLKFLLSEPVLPFHERRMPRSAEIHQRHGSVCFRQQALSGCHVRPPSCFFFFFSSCLRFLSTSLLAVAVFIRSLFLRLRLHV
jgi:hypothetical protein